MTRYLPVAPVLLAALALSPAAAALLPPGECYIRADCRSHAVLDAFAAHVRRHWAVDLRSVSCRFPRDADDQQRAFACVADATTSDPGPPASCKVRATVEQLKPGTYKEVRPGIYKEVEPGTYSVERVQATGSCPEKQPRP